MGGGENNLRKKQLSILPTWGCSIWATLGWRLQYKYLHHLQLHRESLKVLLHLKSAYLWWHSARLGTGRVHYKSEPTMPSYWESCKWRKGCWGKLGINRGVEMMVGMDVKNECAKMLLICSKNWIYILFDPLICDQSVYRIKLSKFIFI